MIHSENHENMLINMQFLKWSSVEELTLITADGLKEGKYK